MKQILKLSDRRENLKQRIEVRKEQHRGHADLDVHLLAATIKQLHAEERWLRRQEAAGPGAARHG
jgi:hypothetical protein